MQVLLTIRGSRTTNRIIIDCIIKKNFAKRIIKLNLKLNNAWSDINVYTRNL